MKKENKELSVTLPESEVAIFEQLPPKMREEVLNKGAADGEDYLVAQFKGLDAEEKVVYRSNLLATIASTRSSGVTLTGYLKAVKFVTVESLNDDLESAYICAYPKEYAKLQDKSINHRDLMSMIKKRVSRSPIINKIREFLRIPVHLMYAQEFDKAIKIQMEIAEDINVHPRDRVSAANSVLSITKAPNINTESVDKDDNASALLKSVIDAMNGLATGQLASINAKKATTESIIEGEIFIKNDESSYGKN